MPEKQGFWTIEKVGQYSPDEPTYALKDERGKERTYGTLADFENLLTDLPAALKSIKENHR